MPWWAEPSGRGGLDGRVALGAHDHHPVTLGLDLAGLELVAQLGVGHPGDTFAVGRVEEVLDGGVLEPAPLLERMDVEQAVAVGVQASLALVRGDRGLPDAAEVHPIGRVPVVDVRNGADEPGRRAVEVVVVAAHRDEEQTDEDDAGDREIPGGEKLALHPHPG